MEGASLAPLERRLACTSPQSKHRLPGGLPSPSCKPTFWAKRSSPSCRASPDFWPRDQALLASLLGQIDQPLLASSFSTNNICFPQQQISTTSRCEVRHMPAISQSGSPTNGHHAFVQQPTAVPLTSGTAVQGHLRDCVLALPPLVLVCLDQAKVHPRKLRARDCQRPPAVAPVGPC